MDRSIENDDFQETSGDKNKTDKDKPIEKWCKICKAKLAIIAKLKKEMSPIHQFIPTGERPLFIPLHNCKMLTIFYSDPVEFNLVNFFEILCWYAKLYELKSSWVS